MGLDIILERPSITETTSMAEDLTDEFVASAMVKEARDNNIQYSAMGLEAFLPKKPTNHPKPNTRFLRNIIKETDTHNAALLAKEAQESKARLREFSSKQRGVDIRKRQLGDIAAILGDSSAKRRKVDEKNADPVVRGRGSIRMPTSRGHEIRDDRCATSPRRRSDDHRLSDSHNSRRSRTHYRGDDELATSRSERKYGRTEDHEHSDTEYSRRREGKASKEEWDPRERTKVGRSRKDRSRSRSGERRRHRRRRSRSRSRSFSDPQDEEPHRSHRSRIKDDGESKKRKYRQTSKPPSNSERDEDIGQRRQPGRDRKYSQDSPTRLSKRFDEARRRQSSKPKALLKPSEPEEDSDPLEDIVGPLPRQKSPVVSRGRGKISAASGIDSRFSANYDPTADVELDFDEENDWEQALEALRDRQKWKQQGAERLKSAGFTDEEIKKWEKGGEKKEEDVKWAKTGEGREWDRGKYLTDDGHVVTGADWGRLK